MSSLDDISDFISPYADEHYIDFYDAHVAKFWKPGNDSDIELVWECLKGILRSKDRPSPITVVDMGTGTGRIIRGLFSNATKEGIKKLDAKFYAVDPGSGMLKRGKDIVDADEEMRNMAPVNWVCSDALYFTTEEPAVRKKTDLLVFAGGGFQHLLSPSEILGFLREIEKALLDSAPHAMALLVILGESLPSKMASIPNYDAEPSVVVSERNPKITYEKSAGTTTWAGDLHVDAFTLSVKSSSDGRVLKEFKFRYDLRLFNEEAWPGLVDQAGLQITREKDYAIGRAYFLQKKKSGA